MKGSKTFTSHDAQKIRILLDRKIGLDSDEQLKIRNEIRDGYWFYITDFKDDLAYCPTYESWKGMTSTDFNWLSANGIISIK